MPAFAAAARGIGDARAVVDTIMHSLAISDEYVDLFVPVLMRLDEEAPDIGVDRAVRAFADEFLGGTEAFRIEPSPDPTLEYDRFCASVKDRRRRTNCTRALARLGFGQEIAARADDALEVVASPSPDSDRDLAIKFLATALENARPDVADRIATGADAALVADRGSGVLGSRARFALMDVHECARGLASSAVRPRWRK